MTGLDSSRDDFSLLSPIRASPVVVVNFLIVLSIPVPIGTAAVLRSAGKLVIGEVDPIPFEACVVFQR